MTLPSSRKYRFWKVKLVGTGLVQFFWPGSLSISLRRKCTEASQKTKLAPPGCRLDQVYRVQPVSAPQQLAPPAYRVLIGQFGRPTADTTPVATSRPAQAAPTW